MLHFDAIWYDIFACKENVDAFWDIMLDDFQAACAPPGPACVYTMISSTFIQPFQVTAVYNTVLVLV